MILDPKPLAKLSSVDGGPIVSEFGVPDRTLDTAAAADLDSPATGETSEPTWLTSLSVETTAAIELPAPDVGFQSIEARFSQQLADSSTSQACTATTCGTDRTFGTAVDWMQNLETASTAAGQHHKLLFVLQVSGNFAIEQFT